MKKFSFVFLFVFLIVATLSAQNQISPIMKDIGGSVSFTLQAQTQNQSKKSQIPIELLDALTKVKFLKQFQFNAGEKSQIFTAFFVFTNYDSFKEWYSTNETKDLLKKLSEYFNGKLNEKFSFTRH